MAQPDATPGPGPVGSSAHPADHPLAGAVDPVELVGHDLVQATSAAHHISVFVRRVDLVSATATAAEAIPTATAVEAIAPARSDK